ncbi:AAA family ATPase [Methanocella sp. MCL-LM]|uniref:AAA family ATPase n=1 Tax=Methanocella sp. MCL-LM TaxID=3412035 RepID=UPI003C714ABB
MIIRRVSLKNIKSYKEAEIELPEGITGISGLNGSGKSTVLEAIGYALFDCLPYTQAEFVRKGEKTGEIIVEIEGSDGLRYLIARKCGASQAYSITDSLGQKFEGKEDVGDRLCEVLGYRVADLDGLQSMFENAIGVLQGTFVSEFLESATKRKTIFDPLLHIDEFNIAFKNLLSLKNLVKDRIDRLENDKKFLEGKTIRLEPLKDEQKILAAESVTLAGTLAEKRLKLAETTAVKESLDALEKSVQELDSRFKLKTAETANARREVADVMTQLQACEAAEKKLADSKPGYDAFLAKNTDKEKLEKQRLERDGLLTIINTTSIKVTELRTKAAASDKALADIEAAEKEIPALTERSIAQEKLEEEKHKTRSMIQAKDIELAQVRERVNKARGSKGNLCPILMGVECSAVTDFTDYFANQTRRIDDEKRVLEAQATTIDNQLRELKNPKLALSMLQEQVKKKTAAQDEKAKLAKELEARNAELMEKFTSLKQYEHVQKEIEQANKDIASFKPAYEAYQQNIKVAGQKTVLQQKLDKATAALDKCQGELSALEKQLSEKRALYDKDTHLQTKSGCELLNREVASTAAKVEEMTRRAKTVADEIRKIEEDLIKIKEIEKAQAEENEYMRFVDISRNIIKSAGPEIVQLYIELISKEATKMYCEIAGDRRLEIRWTADYDIIMIEDGRERSFKQLSGGEQMSAALAVRLAILKILTNSDVVFLDEPTQNMDERRRNNLAQEITRIKDFRQMVVISHDDTFNANLENVIEIEKVNGESTVRRSSVAGP